MIHGTSSPISLFFIIGWSLTTGVEAHDCCGSFELEWPRNCGYDIASSKLLSDEVISSTGFFSLVQLDIKVIPPKNVSSGIVKGVGAEFALGIVKGVDAEFAGKKAHVSLLQKLRSKSHKSNSSQWQPGGTKGKSDSDYQRYLSVPVICTMHLTFQGVLMYCLVSLARNVDELVGHHPDQPSFWTETLIAAGRSIAYPAVMSCLFIAVNMYVLSRTEGQGELQVWAQKSMIVATVGISMQYVIVLVLPFCVHLEKLPKTFAERCGGVMDVHPRVNRFDGFYKSFAYKVIFRILQGSVMIMIYGGTAGAALGMYFYQTYQNQGKKTLEDPIPPHFIATTVIVGAFMFVRLCTWKAQARSRQGNTDALAETTKFQRACLSACFSLQKGPMLALLLLCSKLRAMQLDPWAGTPQEWARKYVYANAAVILAEVFFAGCVGAFGQEEIGYYGAYVFSCEWRILHLLQHACSGASFYGVFVVYESMYLLEAPSGDTPPMPPTMQCILTLSVLYFWIHGGLYISFCLKQVFRWDWKLMQDTLLAANTSVSFTPMLGILLLTVRIRAVQVTNFTGGPQHWAQDAMYICVFAVMVQALCAVALPALTGNDSGVDEEGNATYELGNMAGAYVITVVKYFVLALLAGGVTVIIYSAWVITPETATYSGTNEDFKVVEYIGWAILALLMAMLMSSGKVVGHGVKLLVERAPLPIPLKVKKVVFSIGHGHVELQGVTVPNLWPKKNGFKSSCTMEVSSVIIILEVGLMFRTFFRTIDINAFVIRGVQLNYEKTKCGADSNVSKLMERLNPPQKQENKVMAKLKKAAACGPTDPATGNRSCLPFPWYKRRAKAKSKEEEEEGQEVESGGWFCGMCGGQADEKDSEGKKKEIESKSNTAVVLHTLEIKGVEAYLWHGGSKKMTVQLGKLAFQDFAAQQVSVSDVATIVLTTLLKSIISNGGLFRSACVDIATIPCPGLRPKRAEDVFVPKKQEIFMGARG